MPRPKKTPQARGRGVAAAEQDPPFPLPPAAPQPSFPASKASPLPPRPRRSVLVSAAPIVFPEENIVRTSPREPPGPARDRTPRSARDERSVITKGSASASNHLHPVGFKALDEGSPSNLASPLTPTGTRPLDGAPGWPTRPASLHLLPLRPPKPSPHPPCPFVSDGPLPASATLQKTTSRPRGLSRPARSPPPPSPGIPDALGCEPLKRFG